MPAAAKEEMLASPSTEEIFPLAAGVAALDTSEGASAVRGKKTHQGIFSKNQISRVSAVWLKWSATHQDRSPAWSETVLGPTIYLYDGVNVLAETDQSGNVLARYTGTEKVDEPLAELRSGTTSYYDADGLSSITSLTNASGTIAATYTYDNFGNLSASTGTLINPFRYTAREFDSEIGIYEYRARYYDQNVGRFISEDPLQFDGGDNFYAYTENNPVLYVDPFGLVRYNFGPPRTVPVTGQTAAALNCLEHCLQCLTNNPKLNLLVSEGEQS